jgi:hypothetical protein
MKKKVALFIANTQISCRSSLYYCCSVRLRNIKKKREKFKINYDLVGLLECLLLARLSSRIDLCKQQQQQQQQQQQKCQSLSFTLTLHYIGFSFRIKLQLYIEY